jgi:predicted signal transduction protein with EAL and GGDEF domain
VDGIEHRVGAGAGIALYPRDARTEQDLFRRADEALYRAKAEPRSAVCTYS